MLETDSASIVKGLNTTSVLIFLMCRNIIFTIFFHAAMSIRSVFTYSSRQINELEGRANDNPDDAEAQAEYLKVKN